MLITNPAESASILTYTETPVIIRFIEQAQQQITAQTIAKNLERLRDQGLSNGNPNDYTDL